MHPVRFRAFGGSRFSLQGLRQRKTFGPLDWPRTWFLCPRSVQDILLFPGSVQDRACPQDRRRMWPLSFVPNDQYPMSPQGGVARRCLAGAWLVVARSSLWSRCRVRGWCDGGRRVCGCIVWFVVWWVSRPHIRLGVDSWGQIKKGLFPCRLMFWLFCNCVFETFHVVCERVFCNFIVSGKVLACETVLLASSGFALHVVTHLSSMFL